MTYILFMLMFIISKIVVSYNIPKCINCKWFIKDKRDIEDLGKCAMIVNNMNVDKNTIYYYEYAKHCRDNEFLCGKKAFLFDEIDSNTEYVELISEKEKKIIKILDDNLKNDEHYMNDFSNEEKQYFKHYIKNIAKKYNM